jgi:hypothetical protein
MKVSMLITLMKASKLVEKAHKWRTVRGDSSAEEGGDNTKVEANISTKAPVTDAAVAPEVWLLESGFIFKRVVFVGLEWCIKPTQVPHGSGPMRELDVICVDVPSGEVAEKSSSYDLSILSSGANSQGGEIIAVASRDSSSCIGELWPNIDEIRCEDTSIVHIHDVSVRGRRSTASAENPLGAKVKRTY